MLVRLAALSLALALPGVAVAQEATEEVAIAPHLAARADDIVSVMKGELPYDSVFADAFVSAVPEATFRELIARIEGQFGPILGLEAVSPGPAPNSANIEIRFERGVAAGMFQAEAEPPHRIPGFRITDFRPIDDSPQALLEDLRALPGETAIYLGPLDEGEPIIAHAADRQLAIGSTFKLYVLSALARSIAMGERDWTDVVALGEKSLPSGISQGWPKGSPMTLHTLATLMISISDNTATDQLIGTVGRDAVEAELAASGHVRPALSTPFPTTRELFLLKAGEDTELERYAAGDEATRRAMLEALADTSLDGIDPAGVFGNGPRRIDVEWFASSRDIAGIMRRLAALEDDTALQIMAVNPSMSAGQKEKWAYVGYKGGSEPGVLNLSWLLRDADGKWLVLSMGWSNPAAALDQGTFELLAQRALALAADS